MVGFLASKKRLQVLRMVLEIVNSCLVHQTQHNPNLIYALLYKRELFEAADLNPGEILDYYTNV